MSVKKIWHENKTPILGGAAIVTTFLVYKKIKKEAERRKVLKELKEFREGNRGTINIKQAATQLGQDLGYEYWLIDPRHWTENDTEVINLINAIGPNLIMDVAKEYAKQYPGRNLQKDAQKLLGDKYKQVERVFTGVSNKATGGWMTRGAKIVSAKIK